MGPSRTRAGATSDEEGGEASDVGRIEVSLRTLFEAQSQRLIQMCNNNNLNIEQNAKSIAELNELLLGLSMQVSKLVANDGKESWDISNGRSNDRDSISQFHQNRTYPFSARMTKVDFPKFDGTDLRSWLFKCNQFFQLDGTADQQKV